MTLAATLRQRLARSAHRPLVHVGDMPGAKGRIPAAVLVAITDRPAPGLILTQRPDTMRHHPGQVAFPGGRLDPDDADAVAAALREAEEEIALPRHLPEIVGTVAPYATITGYAVTPVLAVVPPDLPLVPHEREVAAVFEIPLARALDAANWPRRTVSVGNSERGYYESWWDGRRIWGATAAMLVNIADRLR